MGQDAGAAKAGKGGFFARPGAKLIGLFLGLVGLWLAGGGAWLIRLGGSPYRAAFVAIGEHEKTLDLARRWGVEPSTGTP